MMEINIFVVNLSRYTQGLPTGKWFTLPTPFSEIAKKIALGEWEEIAIHDYESPFKISEYESIDRLNEIAECIDDVPEELIRHSDELIGNFYESIEDILENPDKVNFYSDITTDKDFGRYLVDEDLFSVPDNLKGYIDYESLGRDVRYESKLIYVSDGMFWGN